jgi:hypothetical protein
MLFRDGLNARGSCLQELQAKELAVTSWQTERDHHMRSAQDRCRELSVECNHRRVCQEVLARRLAQRDQELAAMRVQVNNQRLGTVVQKFMSSGIEAPHESFEPAFAYHQLQQVFPLVWFCLSDRARNQGHIMRGYMSSLRSLSVPLTHLASDLMYPIMKNFSCCFSSSGP